MMFSARVATALMPKTPFQKVVFQATKCSIGYKMGLKERQQAALATAASRTATLKAMAEHTAKQAKFYTEEAYTEEFLTKHFLEDDYEDDDYEEEYCDKACCNPQRCQQEIEEHRAYRESEEYKRANRCMCITAMECTCDN